jgi:hypothetical protein
MRDLSLSPNEEIDFHIDSTPEDRWAALQATLGRAVC